MNPAWTARRADLSAGPRRLLATTRRAPLARQPPQSPGSFPSANRFRAFTPADLQAYAKAYLAFSTDPNFNAAYDFNGTGFIGQNDATPILRGLASITPRIPFVLTVQLAPGEAILTHHPRSAGRPPGWGR